MSQSQSRGSAADKLVEAQELLSKDQLKLQEFDNDINEENKKWEKEKAKLEKEHKKLQREVEQLEKEKEHVDRLTSSSRDARKMYGDMTPGDTTHHDVTLLYQNHFKNSHRNMPKKLDKTKSEEKYEIWGKSAEIVQAFDTNKTRLLKMMLKKVEEAITEDHEELGEATYDLQRAFEMFLQTDYFSKEVAAVLDLDLIIGDDEDKKLVKDILLTLKPDDYLHFIKNGKPRERKLQEITLDE